MYKNLKKVAIVGKPNVGKSTLFNRLIQKRVSITSNVKGVTRDRLYHIVTWLGREFVLIDTGGFSNEEAKFQLEINKQVEIAIEQADIIIFMTSMVDDITKEDLIVSKKLKEVKNKKIIIVPNKSDNLEMSIAASNFYKLGFKTLIPISSIHGIGISDLLDEIIKGDEEVITSDSNAPKIGIIGKPNVGKSTLVNKVLNDERIIVSPIAGTTRDAIDTFISVNDKDYILTDTAGIKKKKTSLDDIEWYAELRSELTIMNSDITLLMLDISQGFEIVDEKILSLLSESYKPTIIIVNKIDKIKGLDRHKIREELAEKFKFASWAPIIFISAQNKKYLHDLFNWIEVIEERRHFNVSKQQLNNFLMEVQILKKPPRNKGIEIKLKYITYSNTKYPHFIIFANHPDRVHFSYQRFLENQLRNIFKLEGIPIKITFRKG